MQIEDIIRTIDFHDSNLIELIHENDRVRLKIDLCMWKQEGYQEGDDELKEVVLEFDPVRDYTWDSDKAETDIDYNTILEISYCNRELKVVLADEGTTIVAFKCDTVKYVV